jgi:hypothetical protein
VIRIRNSLLGTAVPPSSVAQPGINRLLAFQNKILTQVTPFEPALLIELVGAMPKIAPLGLGGG